MVGITKSLAAHITADINASVCGNGPLAVGTDLEVHSAVNARIDGVCFDLVSRENLASAPFLILTTAPLAIVLKSVS